jgi:hypothetical protein
VRCRDADPRSQQQAFEQAAHAESNQLGGNLLHYLLRKSDCTAWTACASTGQHNDRILMQAQVLLAMCTVVCQGETEGGRVQRNQMLRALMRYRDPSSDLELTL